MKFEREYFIHYYDTDINNKLSVTGLMKYFEDIALLQSEAVGLGLQYYERKKVAWLLFKWDIKIKSLPTYKDVVKIITQPIGFKRYYAYRKFEVMNLNGEILVEADSIWLLIDTNVRKPIQITDDMYNGYGLTQPNDYIPEVGKFEEVSNPQYEKDFMVNQGDIDLNDHVNNVKYIEWALETLPIDLLKNSNLLRVKVIYKKETTLGRVIKSSAEIKSCDNGYFILHKISDESDLCIINTEWKF